MEANAVWLAGILIVVLLLDAVACSVPLDFIKKTLDRLDVSTAVRQAIPVVKFAAAVGLVLGLFVPLIGVLTAAALVAYFGVACWYHRRANDRPIEYVGATLGAVAAGAVGVVSFATAL